MGLKKASPVKHLDIEKLVWMPSEEDIKFNTTEEIIAETKIVGQERALKALRMGAEIFSHGYNIYIAGMSGTGKATTIKKVLEEIKPKNIKLKDYAYVNNFKEPERPILLTFEAGEASKFKKDVENTIEYLRKKIPQALESDQHIERQKAIIQEYQSKEIELFLELDNQLKQKGFTIGRIKDGQFARPEIFPIIQGQPVYIEALDALVQENKLQREEAQKIYQDYQVYQEKLGKAYRAGLKLNQELNYKIQLLEKETISIIVRSVFDELKEKYKDEKIHAYFEEIINDIYENIYFFKEIDRDEDDIYEQQEYFRQFIVNVILDNSNVAEAPVILEINPTYTNLFGAIEKVYDGYGNWTTDFTKIKAGSFLKANGGYLILNANDALMEPGVWKTLKRTLLYSLLEIQDFFSYYQLTMTMLKPEPIPVNTKVILIGSQFLYYLLCEYEDDFKKIFKIKADFDYEMKNTRENLEDFLKVVKYLIERDNLSNLDKSGIKELLRIAARYVESQRKLTTRFSFISDMLREANYFAAKKNLSYINDLTLKEAYKALKERHGLIDDKITEEILENKLLIDLEGEKIGQVNGLSVYGSDFISYGKPVKITAAISKGDGKIISIEREVGFSGSIFDKGVLVISGYIGETFGKKINLSFKASLCFEQGYGPIEGDSASAAELCAILSALAEVPIKQNIAITGSVNQKGEIQPIGGVNEKIEGFYKICKLKNIKNAAVIIPRQNESDLMLDDEVLDAVRNGNFFIYSIAHVKEAIEILTGYKAGEILKNGEFEKNSLYELIEKNLVELSRDEDEKKKTRKKKSQSSSKKKVANKK